MLGVSLFISCKNEIQCVCVCVCIFLYKAFSYPFSISLQAQGGYQLHFRDEKTEAQRDKLSAIQLLFS